MTVNKFIEEYAKDNLVHEPLSIGSTALRNWIKENKADLEKENIVKFKKKLNSLSIDIVDSEGLYKRIS
jgi:hypothetical protein